MIHDVTVLPNGDVLSERVIDPGSVSREALAVVETWIGAAEQSGGAAPCPAPDMAYLGLRWTEHEPGVALATLTARGVPLTTSILIRPGVSAWSVREVRGALQRLQRSIAGPGTEVGYDWHADDRRPLIQSLLHGLGDPEDLAMAADVETCMAAAWLR